MQKSGGISGIILAGGKGSRMGRNKAVVMWKGKRLVEWIYAALKPICTEFILSSNEIIPVSADIRIVADINPGIGPAAGIEAGLITSNTETNIIVSCDTPNLSTEFFLYMLASHNDFDISIPIHGGINEPMIGIYNKSVSEVFQKAISSGLNKPPAIIKSCRYQEVNIDSSLNFYSDDMFLNLNSPEDLKKQ